MHLEVKFAVNLNGNIMFMMQSVIKSIVRVVKCNFFFVFNGLRRGAIGSFHIISYFSIQVNGKLNVGVQSVTNVIV